MDNNRQQLKKQVKKHDNKKKIKVFVLFQKSMAASKYIDTKQEIREPQLALQLPCPIKHTLIIVQKGYERLRRVRGVKRGITIAKQR